MQDTSYNMSEPKQVLLVIECVCGVISHACTILIHPRGLGKWGLVYGLRIPYDATLAVVCLGVGVSLANKYHNIRHTTGPILSAFSCLFLLHELEVKTLHQLIWIAAEQTGD